MIMNKASDNISTVEPKLKEIVDRVEQMRKYYSEPYDRMGRDMEFRDGRQHGWGVNDQSTATKEENFTVIHTKRFVNRVVNSMRMNPYGINVDGAGDDYGDIIRQAIKEIESRSHAYDAYTVGLENSASVGRGAIVIDTAYISDESDQQEICIEICTDPKAVHLDPGHQRIDGSDAKYGSYSSYIDKKFAIEEYGEEACEPGDFAYLYPEWAAELSYIPQVCYQEIESVQVTRHFLHNGGHLDEGQHVDKKQVDIMKINGAIKSSRKISKKQLHIYKVVGTKIVYEAELSIPYLMIVPMYGDRYYRDGRWDWTGLVHLLKTPAILANLYKSKEVDLAKLAPRSPWMLALAQAKGYEEQWANANSVASDALIYNAISDANGAPVPPPQRVDNTAQTAQLTASYMQCVNDMHTVTGMPMEMFGTFEGANSSGKAVLSRQQFSEIATAQYMTHCSQSIEQVGRVVLALIPIIYVEDRTFTIIDEDGKAKEVTINFSKAPINWSSMKVEVSSGPSYESRRKETVEALTQMFPPGDPQSQLVKDIIVNELDTPYAKAIARRLRKTLPPGIVGDDKGGEPPDPQAIAALNQAHQTITNLEEMGENLKNMLIQTQAELKQIKSSHADDIRIKEMELSSDERKTAIVEANKYRVAALNAASKGIVAHDVEAVADNLMTQAQESLMLTRTMGDVAIAQGQQIITQQDMPTQPARQNLPMSHKQDPFVADQAQAPQG